MLLSSMTYRLPKPNAALGISLMPKDALCFWSANRSGLKRKGSGYMLGSCNINLQWIFSYRARKNREAYQTLGRIVVFLGILYPRYSSSVVTVRAKPNGVTETCNGQQVRGSVDSAEHAPGFHLKHSHTMHSIYGRLSLSSNVGSLSDPTTRSNSACAFTCIFG